jgi:hypothetical protein
MDQAGQCQVAPAAGQVLEAAGGAGLIDLQPVLADGRHLADHGWGFMVDPVNTI